MTVKDLEDIWPPFRLRLLTGPLDLRTLRDTDIPALVSLAEGGIHEPDAMPFAFPWSAAPRDELGRNMAAFYWRERADFTTARWSLQLVVRWHGDIAGIQGFSTENYLVTRTGETGSWLGREFQGRGIGTLMRQTLCAFLFDHLDAHEVTSAGFLDNPASLAVSRKVGFSANGRTRRQRRQGEMAICQLLVLRPQDLVRPDQLCQVDGETQLRSCVGLDATQPTSSST